MLTPRLAASFPQIDAEIKKLDNMDTEELEEMHAVHAQRQGTQAPVLTEQELSSESPCFLCHNRVACKGLTPSSQTVHSLYTAPHSRITVRDTGPIRTKRFGDTEHGELE